MRSYDVARASVVLLQSEGEGHTAGPPTLTVYAGLTGDGRDKAIAKLAEGGFGA